MTSWRLGTCTLFLGPPSPLGDITSTLSRAWSKLCSGWHPIAGPTQPATTLWPELQCHAAGSCRLPQATDTVGPYSCKTEEASTRPFLLNYLISQLPSKNYGWSWGSLLLLIWRQTPIYPGRLIFHPNTFSLMMLSCQNIQKAADFFLQA